MSRALNIRTATSADLGALLQLYLHLTPNNVPFSTSTAEEIFGRFLVYEGSAILLGECANTLVASCTVVVIPNLTRGGNPYALIENVVTHQDHRRAGYGKLILDAATKHAFDHGCYKVMLMTGAKDVGTLDFYKEAGFAQTKTGFQKRRAIEVQTPAP